MHLLGIPCASSAHPPASFVHPPCALCTSLHAPVHPLYSLLCMPCEFFIHPFCFPPVSSYIPFTAVVQPHSTRSTLIMNAYASLVQAHECSHVVVHTNPQPCMCTPMHTHATYCTLMHHCAPLHIFVDPPAALLSMHHSAAACTLVQPCAHLCTLTSLVAVLCPT